MHRLKSIKTKTAIFPEYRNTPIGHLLEYHNLDTSYRSYTKAELLIGMCMDHRKRLRIPENFAYIVRTGGANLRYSEFKVSYAIAVGGVKSVALIGHSNCGMVNLISKKEAFINGLNKNAGWERELAEEHFMHYAAMFEIRDAGDFILGEAKRLRSIYPQILIAPLYYKVEDNLLYMIEEN